MLGQPVTYAIIAWLPLAADAQAGTGVDAPSPEEF